jgi:hypothetical protein
LFSPFLRNRLQRRGIVLAFAVIILMAVGSDYNLLLVRDDHQAAAIIRSLAIRRITRPG